ncbi:hypothetical protein [Sandaracinus amylolyticus]|uniref:Uncharacterized protein n=1 Tax=Sandaracinus amylolyticus TaxID=927083 RepID=A0A0F6YJ66_9BACT|nr:hypothetical protein [Sandaracinus amylolyticus]AKF06635.1 hypothetical protein DB32_003784 [Sandaracinus amylolyticus]
MSTFDVRFVRGAIPAPEVDAGLEGAGTIEAAREGMTIRATRRRGGLATVLACVLGVVAMLVVVVTAVMIADAMFAGVDITKGVAALGILALGGGGMGAFSVLERVLPRAAVTITVPWAYVVTARVSGSQLQVVTTAPALSGTTTIDAPDIGALLEALERARA